VCFGDAARYCIDCDLTYCAEHYDDAHESDAMAGHQWKGADTDKVRTQHHVNGPQLHTSMASVGP
jgi:hypothetical protein